MRVYPPKNAPLKSHRHLLTAIEKGRVMQAHLDGKSYSEIGAELNIPASTIGSFIERCHKRKSHTNLPHVGRPRKTSNREDRYIIRTALDNTAISNSVLRDITNQDLSVSTIRRRLREDQIRKWRAVIRPLLTSAHAKARLKWAMQWRGLTIDEWRQVIWSDECAVQRDSDGTVKWVFRHQNKREKYDPKNIRGKTKAGSISQMIWGTFAGNKLGPIVFVEGNQFGCLHNNFERKPPSIYRCPYRRRSSISDLSKDNATSHVSKKTQDWFAIA